MHFVTVTVILLVLAKLTMINRADCRKKHHFFDNLFQQGKSLLSRSTDKWKFSEPDSERFFPEHRYEDQQGLELPDDIPFSQGQLPNSRRRPQGLQSKNNKNSGYVLYRTEIIENDNMDLYSLIGGISFASLLVTTLYLLGRNRRNSNGSFGKTLDDMTHTNNIADLHHHNGYNLSTSQLAQGLATYFLTPQKRKLRYNKQEGH